MLKQTLIAASILFYVATPAISGQLNMSLITPTTNQAIILAASNNQCLKKCIDWNQKCQNLVTEKGDKAGWNNKSRDEAYAKFCEPHVDSCQKRCGPMQPGECRIMGGEMVCS